MKLKILIAGSLPKLKQELDRIEDYQVEVEPNLIQAIWKFQNDWFHLGIVQIDSTNENEAEALLSALRSGNDVPKIVLISKPLDPQTKLVRQSLASLGQPASAVAVLSSEENIDEILIAIRLADKERVRINRQLTIVFDESFYGISKWIMPEYDVRKGAEEIEDLFRILFQHQTKIEIKRYEYLRGRRSEFTSMIVYPASMTVPYGYPVLVKIGRRETIERARKSYDEIYFRITNVRESGFSKTMRFAAIAYPVPSSEIKSVKDFSTFFRDSVKTNDFESVYKTIDHLFEIWQPWQQQTISSQELTSLNLRSYYLGKFGSIDKQKCTEHFQHIIDQAPNYGAIMRLDENELSIQFNKREKPYTFPNPIQYIFNEKPFLKVFNLPPTHLRLVHGDLRAPNLGVDSDNQVWLDGYECVDLGPAFVTMAGLEALLKFHCLDCSSAFSLFELFDLEIKILSPGRFEDYQNIDVRGTPEFNMLFNAVKHLRTKWAKRLSHPDMEEYYCNLFFLTMRELVCEEAVDQLQYNPELRQLYALLSAAMICSRLKDWSNWKGWSSPKKILPIGAQRE